MNKIQRTRISHIIEKLGNIKSEIEIIKTLEESTRDNLSDYPQFDSKVIDIEIAIDSLDEAIISIDSSIKNLIEAK